MHAEDLSSLCLSDLQLCLSLFMIKVEQLKKPEPSFNMDSEPKNSSILMHPEPLHGFH